MFCRVFLQSSTRFSYLLLIVLTLLWVLGNGFGDFGGFFRDFFEFSPFFCFFGCFRHAAFFARVIFDACLVRFFRIFIFLRRMERILSLFSAFRSQKRWGILYFWRYFFEKNELSVLFIPVFRLFFGAFYTSFCDSMFFVAFLTFSAVLGDFEGRKCVFLLEFFRISIIYILQILPLCFSYRCFSPFFHRIFYGFAKIIVKIALFGFFRFSAMQRVVRHIRPLAECSEKGRTSKQRGVQTQKTRTVPASWTSAFYLFPSRGACRRRWVWRRGWWWFLTRSFFVRGTCRTLFPVLFFPFLSPVRNFYKIFCLSLDNFRFSRYNEIQKRPRLSAVFG